MPKEVPRVNWRVLIECLECGATYHIMKPASSTERLSNGNRMLLVTVPNECPECHSLRVVEEGGG